MHALIPRHLSSLISTYPPPRAFAGRGRDARRRPLPATLPALGPCHRRLPPRAVPAAVQRGGLDPAAGASPIPSTLTFRHTRMHAHTPLPPHPKVLPPTMTQYDKGWMRHSVKDTTLPHPTAGAGGGGVPGGRSGAQGHGRAWLHVCGAGQQVRRQGPICLAPHAPCPVQIPRPLCYTPSGAGQQGRSVCVCVGGGAHRSSVGPSCPNHVLARSQTG